jgi:hypothetical protein
MLPILRSTKGKDRVFTVKGAIWKSLKKMMGYGRF